jgi:hypothetical protein
VHVNETNQRVEGNYSEVLVVYVKVEVGALLKLQHHVMISMCNQ